jgi:phospholipase C
MISPWARRGYIDHQTLSFDAYLKFIEDRFLGGSRLDPRTDGWPDSRPTVREERSSSAISTRSSTSTRRRSRR